MRAVCEKCGAAQPPDWKAGDLCGGCGAAVRRDVRCFWCAKWTPFAKFCRSCGAEVVDERLYGAARMLKDAGTDRFTVPKMLREFDADQVENFTRLYQRHAVAVARHVDEVRFLERFLFHRHWSGALHDELVPQLPWPEETLEAMSGPPLPPGDDLATARAIHDSTPLGRTRALALLARVRLDDWSAWRDADRLASSGEFRPEAALVLTGWRVRSGCRLPDDWRELIEELRRSPFKTAAGVRVALLTRDPDAVPREAIGHPDPEIAFTAALVRGDVDRLQAALSGDSLEKIAAGHRLVELGILKPVEEVIEKSPLEVQRELVDSLVSRKEPAPQMADTLIHIVETTADETLRERAARVLCRQLRPDLAMRIARAAKGERYIFQSLLSEEAALPSETLGALAAWMVENGSFTSSQYGLLEAGKRGAIPDRFVPGVFPRADEETRRELLSFAENQLAARGDEELHRFVMNVVFGEHPAKTRAAAWWVLHRGYRQGDPRGEGPFRLSRAPIERFFGSVGAFVPKLSAMLREPEVLKEVGVYEFLANLFSSATAGDAAAIAGEKGAAHDLVRAILEALRGDYWAYLIDGMIQFLGLIGTDEGWRDEAIRGLEALEKTGNYHWEKSLRTLRLSLHGLPDESEWPQLPDDFVPSRFGSATGEGRRQLLRAAEQQLIHRQPESVARFLLTVAFGPYDVATRIQAIELFGERAPREIQRLPLKPGPIGRIFGSMGSFLPGFASALSEPALLGSAGFRDFLGELIRDRDAAAIAGEPAAGDLVPALLGLAGMKGEGGHFHNLRMDAIRLLGDLGGDSRWRKPVASGLRTLLDQRGFDLGAECERALGLIDPAPVPGPPPAAPGARVPRPTRPGPAPLPVENPWAAKQLEAERLGKELQEAALKISFGPGSPEEKTRAVMQLQEEFQAKIKSLYGG
jgi:hypothetical protein